MARPRQRLVILADSRETLPFVFKNHTVRRTKLDTGDYTLHGYIKLLSVERKGFGDFLSCIGSRWEKFMSPGGQIDRLHNMDFSLLVVEGTIRRAQASCYQVHHLPESVILQRVAEISMWVPILFCDTRLMARDVTLAYLKKAKEMIDE